VAFPRPAHPRVTHTVRQLDKGAKLLQKIITGACIVGIIAFLGQATLAPFYSMGIFGVTGSIMFISYAVVLWAFMRRQGWSWIFAFVLGLVIPIMSVIFRPAEETYGELIWIARLLVFSQALACLVILVIMFVPATKSWFRDERIEPDFHRGKELEISYYNSFGDLLWFNLYQLPRAPTFYIVSGLLLLGAALIVFGFLSGSEYPLLVRTLTYIAIVIPMFCGIAALSFITLVIAYIYRKIRYQRTGQNSHLSISESGVMCKSPSDLRQIKWSGIVKVHQSANYILLYLSDIAAFLIPKSAFRESNDADQFFNQSLEYSQNAKKTPISK